MRKKSLLIFSIGAAVGWTAAKRVSGEAQTQRDDSWPAPGGELSQPDALSGYVLETAPEAEPEQIEPFSAAFESTLAQVHQRSFDLGEGEREVA